MPGCRARTARPTRPLWCHRVSPLARLRLGLPLPLPVLLLLRLLQQQQVLLRYQHLRRPKQWRHQLSGSGCLRAKDAASPSRWRSLARARACTSLRHAQLQWQSCHMGVMLLAVARQRPSIPSTHLRPSGVEARSASRGLTHLLPVPFLPFSSRLPLLLFFFHSSLCASLWVSL